MKKVVLVLSFLFISLSSYADQTFVFHEAKERSGDPLQKTFTLNPHRKVTVDLSENLGDMRFNSLNLILHCPPKRQIIKLGNLPTVCGVTSLSYSEKSQELTVYLTKYNSTTPSGDCSGDTYTEVFSLKDKCE